MSQDMPPREIGNVPAQRLSQWSAWIVLAGSLTIALIVWRLSLLELEGHGDVSMLLLIFGLVVSLLLSGLAWSLTRTRQRALQMAQEMTETLRRSEERWSFALEGAGDGVWDWNLQTGEALYSRRWKRIFGFAEEEIGNTADEWLKRVHPDDMPAVQANMQAVLDGEVRNAVHELRMSCKDGSWKWILGRGMVISRDAAGKALRMVGTASDITLRKQDELLRNALIDAQVEAGIGLAALNQGRIISANAVLTDLSGYTLEELQALPDFSSVVCPEDRERVMCLHLLRLAGESCATRYEIGLLTKSGERRDAEIAVTYQPNSDEFQVLVVLVDITERKQLSVKLQQSHDLLVKLSAQVPGIIFQLRLYPDGHASIPFISDTIEELSGISPEAVLEDASHLAAIHHPDDAESIAASFMEAAQSLRPWHHEYRVILPKKGMRWQLGEGRAEKLEDGSIVLHCYVSDITERKAAEEALRASNERFRSLTQLGADWYWEQDENFRFTEMSGGSLYHQSNSAADVIGKTRWELDCVGVDESVWQAHREQLERHEPFRNFEFKRRDNKGQVHIISVCGEPVFDVTGRFSGYRGVGSEITERKQAEEGLQLAALVYQNSSEAMSVSAPDGTIIAVNSAFTRITGYSANEVVGQHTHFFNSGRHDQVSYDEVLREIHASGHWQGEIWSRRKNNEMYPALVTVNTIFNADGTPYRHVSLFSDITNRKQTEELIWKQANFDTLTQLPNRSMFHERVAQEIKKTNRVGLQLALLFIDLDHFKEVNDTLGHDTGDLLLVEAARRIRACVRETDAVARLGGDEFTVLLSGIEKDEAAIVERIARNILDNLIAPFHLGNEEAYVSASIGITLYPGDATSIEGLFKNADQAMYLSKHQGRNRYSYFTPELQDAAQFRLRMINDLRCALSGHQFQVYFQPVVDLLTGHIVKAEALIRWSHPQRGMVLPGEFISLAEETGLIHEIGDWVFREAARWAKRWKTGRNSDFQISVNKSPVQFHRDTVGHLAWLSHLHWLGLSGESISIEITEGLLLNADSSVSQSLLGCRDAGIQVAIDDFGTGYSSLAYLKKFDIDYLKIDQSFIRSLTPDTTGLALPEAIIVMAHKLGLKVIAEGVETELQRDLLISIGCDYAQGYLFARPMPPEEFEKLLLADGN